MSDVGDVNRAHQPVPEVPDTEMYMRSARRILSSGASMEDRLRFLKYHSAVNVVKLANIIDALRAENAELMEQIFKLDS